MLNWLLRITLWRDDFSLFWGEKKGVHQHKIWAIPPKAISKKKRKRKRSKHGHKVGTWHFTLIHTRQKLARIILQVRIKHCWKSSVHWVLRLEQQSSAWDDSTVRNTPGPTGVPFKHSISKEKVTYRSVPHHTLRRFLQCRHTNHDWHTGGASCLSSVFLQLRLKELFLPTGIKTDFYCGKKSLFSWTQCLDTTHCQRTVEPFVTC